MVQLDCSEGSVYCVGRSFTALVHLNICITNSQQYGIRSNTHLEFPINYFHFRPETYASEVRRFCASRALESSLHSSCMAVARLKNRLLDPDLKDTVIEAPKIQFLIVNILWLQPGVPLVNPYGCACAIEKIFWLSGATTDAIFLEQDAE